MWIDSMALLEEGAEAVQARDWIERVGRRELDGGEPDADAELTSRSRRSIFSTSSALLPHPSLSTRGHTMWTRTGEPERSAARRGQKLPE